MNSMSDFSSWQGREVILKPIEWLKPHPDNPRMITDADVTALAEAIDQLGFNDPIECRETGEILCGHLRLQAAKRLKLQRLPVIIHGGLSDQEANAYRISHNKLGERVKWNRSMLADQVASLSESFAPDVMGFDDAEVAKLFDLDLGFQDDQQPEKAESEEAERGPLVRQGETWHFGTLAHLTVWSDRPESLRKVEELIGKMQKWMKVKATLGDEDGPTFEATIAERAMGQGEQL